MNRSAGLRIRAIPLVLLLVFTLILTVVLPLRAWAAPVDCSRGVNLGFETPLVRDNPMGPPPNWALFDESLVPGWFTSAPDDMIELWESTFLGVPSFAGDQHAELNANVDSILHQDFPTLEGDSIDWFVAHRGRVGTESADLRFGAPGSPVIETTMTSPTGVWTTYSGTYAVPAGQTTTRMSFDSLVGGSLGNFLDGIVLELECEITVATAFAGFTDVDSSGHTNPGDSADFQYVVTNVGSATMEGLTVTDTLGVTVSCPATTLMPGDSTTCTATHVLTAADVDGGSVDSDATATATDAAGVSASDNDTHSDTIASVPSMTVDKSASLDDTVVLPAGRADAGDIISYNIEVTNAGNVTLDPVSVTDPTVGAVTCSGTTLDSGAMMACTASLTLTQADIDSGSVVNAATATGTPPTGGDVSDVDSATVNLIAAPGMGLSKSFVIDNSVVAPAGRIDAGDRITYTISVANTGNVTLSSMSVTDSLLPGVSCPGTSIAPSSSVNCVGTLTVDQTDINAGSITNTASASASPPSGPDVMAQGSVAADLLQKPVIGLAKSLNGFELQVDGTIVITFVYTATNYGNVTVSNLAITDDIATLFSGLSPMAFTTIDGSLSGSGSWDGSAPSNILATGQWLVPGESGDVSARFVITASTATTIDNTAVVNGDDHRLAPMSDDSVDGTDPDPDMDDDPTNNASPTQVVVPGLYDLSVAKNGVEGPEAGQATWIVTISNAGPADAPGTITVTDSTGQGLTIVSASGTGWVCTTTSSVATCTDTEGLAAGAASVITIATDAESGTPVTNTATVAAGDGNDTDPGNDTDVLSLVIGDLPFTGFSAERLALLALLLLLGGFNLIRLGARRQDSLT